MSVLSVDAASNAGKPPDAVDPALSRYPQIGRILLESGRLDKIMVERVQRLVRENNESFDLVLTRLGLVTEAELAQILSRHLNLPLFAPGAGTEPAPLNRRLNEKFLKQKRLFVVESAPGALAAVMADPTDDAALNAIQFVLDRRLSKLVGCASDIDTVCDRFFGVPEKQENAAESDSEEDLERLKDMASGAPVVRLVNQIISRAIELRASDIHIEPMNARLRLRYRVDGMLQEGEALPDRLKAAIASRLKVMAKLNIAERRLAQDGRISVSVRGQEIDLRMSTTPAVHGESIVLRILDKSGVVLDFGALGFTEGVMRQFREVLHKPHGIVLVTGPTGSGKTTTLYAGLSELNQAAVKILTIEDPVEYQIDGITQVAVKPAIGLTFATALRSFLRQDPDIMMVGEIRDLETAQIAVQAALTGHLVLSTLHTNDAASAVSRLMDMGVEDYLLASTLNGVVGQRLVRRLCVSCREAHEPSPEQITLLEQANVTDRPGPWVLWRPIGCDLCSGSGYAGRVTIHELLIFDDALRRLIMTDRDAAKINRLAVETGMTTMYADGILKALAGITTIEEVLRVTQDS